MKNLLMNKNLLFLLCGQFISQIGDKFYSLALAYWVLQTTNSPSFMGLVLFFSMAPAIVTGFFSGGVIDFINRKTLLVNVDIIRGFVIFAVAGLYYAGSLNMFVIIAAQVILSICSAFFNPTVSAVIPQIVERDELSRANAKSKSGFHVIYPYIFIFFSMSSAVVIISTCYRSILQKNVDNEMAGRVFGIIDSIGNFTYPIAILLFGVMLDWFQYGPILMATGILIICFGFVLFKYNRHSTEINF